MPKIRAGKITMNYDQQGNGEPLVLIPYLAADYACYAFQVAEYLKHFTCISVDLRGTSDRRHVGLVTGVARCVLPSQHLGPRRQSRRTQYQVKE